jgi:hypothetical protein
MQFITRAGLIATILVASLCAMPSAHAQSVDRVDLVGGGFVRGTILEHIPGDHVTIQLSNGEVRTIPTGEIAGISSELMAIPEPAPAIAPGPPMATVTVTSDLEGVTVHRVTGTATMRYSRLSADSFELLCAVPCTFSLPVGTHDLAWARGGRGDPRRFGPHLVLNGPVSLHVQYETHGDDQLLGALFIAGGVLVGGALIAPGLFELTVATSSGIDFELAIAGLVSGGIILLAGVIIGAVFASHRNRINLLRDGAITF